MRTALWLAQVDGFARSDHARLESEVTGNPNVEKRRAFVTTRIHGCRSPTLRCLKHVTGMTGCRVFGQELGRRDDDCGAYHEAPQEQPGESPSVAVACNTDRRVHLRCHEQRKYNEASKAHPCLDTR